MTNSAYWSEHSQWLKPFVGQVDIGLHINFTEGKPLTSGITMMPLSELLRRAYLKKLNKDALTAELNAQIDVFESAMSQSPDFLDGHQHVHQFPVIREVVLNVYEKRFPSKTCYVRCIADSKAFMRFGEGYFKRLILQLTDAASLKNELVQRHVPHNASFSGVYDFAKGHDYAKKFPHFLEQIESRGLIMCHPGLPSAIDFDPIYTARQYEYAYLSSDQFIQDCNQHGVVITRFKSMD